MTHTVFSLGGWRPTVSMHSWRKGSKLIQVAGGPLPSTQFLPPQWRGSLVAISLCV